MEEAIGSTPLPSVSRFLSRFSSASSSFKSTRSSQSSRLCCRICFDSAPADTLLSPCRCSGSLAIVHQACLEKWLSTANHSHCEICGHQFQVIRKTRPLRHWFLTRPFPEAMVGDLVCFVVLTPLALVSAYLCATGAVYYLDRDAGQQGKLEAAGLLFLCTFLVLVYLVWLVITARFHVLEYREWRSHNQDICLAEPRDRGASKA